MNKNIRPIAKLFSEATSEKELATFIEDLFTPEEIHTIAQRLELLKLLKQGMPQRTIAEKLGCGIATVTRGSRIVKNGKGALLQHLDQS